MITEDIIDVTILEPRMKHPTIFRRFDELTEGESLVIVNDHDPKPLYYQMAAERGEIFSWEYLESGPEQWQVRIGKNKSNTQSASIGEIVASDFRTAEVFRKYKIDFCCGGKKSLTQVCKEKNIDVTEVNRDLKFLGSPKESPASNFSDWDPAFLVDYIVNVHHKYVSNAIPLLLEYTTKVSKVHGAAHEEVIAIADLFREASEELISHMGKEENILFPYIKQLADKANDEQPTAACSFGSVQNPIRMMEHEHEVVGDIFKTIRELSNDYTPPEEACATYKVSYLKLKEFEEDLHQHIHLENNILFPKSVELEMKH